MDNTNGDAASCASGNNMSLGGNSTASRIFTITGYSNIVVATDWFEDSNLDAGEYFYADYRLDGGAWVRWFTGPDGGPIVDTWYCDETLSVPGTGDTLEVRFSNNASGGSEDGRVDNFSVTGDLPSGGTWIVNAQVQLVDPSARVTTLKAYNEADGSPYDVLPYYTGPGTYIVRLSENLGGTATLTLGSMRVDKNPCDYTNCGGAAPGEVDATTTKFSDKNTLDWEAVAGATGYYVYRGIREDLPELLLNNPDDSCRADVAAATTWDISSHTPPAPGNLYWYLITAYNGSGEGTAGYASGPTERLLNFGSACP